MDKGVEFKDLLSFNVMLFPKLATVCYLALAGLSIFVGFVAVIRGIAADWGGVVMVISGLAMMIVVPVLLRLVFELLLVLFAINDKLKDIQGALTKSTDTAGE